MDVYARYWLFAGYDDNPSGGIKDCILTSNDQADLIREADKPTSEDLDEYEYVWWHIVDSQTGEITKQLNWNVRA